MQVIASGVPTDASDIREVVKKHTGRAPTVLPYFGAEFWRAFHEDARVGVGATCCAGEERASVHGSMVIEVAGGRPSP